MEDALADPLAAPAATEEPEEEAKLQGYNPSEGELPPGELPPEAEAAAPEPEEDEVPPANPDDIPAGPSPEEEEHDHQGEGQTTVGGSEEEVEALAAEVEAEAPPVAPLPDDVPPQTTPPPDSAPPPSPPPAEEPAPPPAPEPDPEPAPPSKPSNSKNRVYYVFEEAKRGDKIGYFRVPECLYTKAEQERFDGEAPTGELESRNGDNALRAAYRRLSAAREDEDLRITLVIVASGYWRPKPIKPRARNLPPALEIG